MRQTSSDGTCSVPKKTLRSIIPDTLYDALQESSAITTTDDENYRSEIRVSNFYLPSVLNRDSSRNAKPLYYIHSRFPASSDSVFFGPDTYLFVSFLRNATSHLLQPPKSIIDVCCGSGAGAIHMARTYPQASVYGLDLNPRALRLGCVNAQLAGVHVTFETSNLFASAAKPLKQSGVDLIVSNPPYIGSSPDGGDLPIYANGGAHFGLDISFRILEEGSKILSEQGIIILYTGVAIPAAEPGRDVFLDRLREMPDMEVVEYTVLHPDMWSEEIGIGAYADACRIQAVGAVVRRIGR